MKDFQDQLQALSKAYAENLPHKINEIELAWQLLSRDWNQNLLRDFHLKVHNISGTAGTYGYTQLSANAKKLDTYLKTLFDKTTVSTEQKCEIFSLLNSLKSSAFITTELAELPIAESKKQTENTLYVLDSDPIVLETLIKSFKHSNYHFVGFSSYEELKAAITHKSPMAMLIDSSYLNEDFISYLANLHKDSDVAFFISSQDTDLSSRLRALRTGCSAFLAKPINVLNLSQILDKLSSDTLSENHRILIIDDSQSLAEYYALILQSAGMTTTFMTNPFQLMDTLAEFQPNLILTDLYIPGCSGLELASVLRQDPRYVRLPIIFISSEDDRFKQLTVMSSGGGDDFLTKPVQPHHLVAAVKTRIKRSSVLEAYISQDGLTGLLNHTHILQRLELELLRAKRQNQLLSFAMIDIDNFKHVNDQYGHLVGDFVLQRLARFLLENLRRTDIVGRYGGEEFAVIFPNTSLESSIHICNQLRQEFSEIAFNEKDTDFTLQFSAGITCYPDFSTLKELVQAADDALYRAKSLGRNQVQYYKK